MVAAAAAAVALLLLLFVVTEDDCVYGVLMCDVSMNQTQTPPSTRPIDFNTIIIKTLKIAFVLRRCFLCNYFAMRGQRSRQNNSVIVIVIDISIENSNSWQLISRSRWLR